MLQGQRKYTNVYHRLTTSNDFIARISAGLFNASSGANNTFGLCLMISPTFLAFPNPNGKY